MRRRSVQSVRITILEELLSGFDDGRSMSFFCLCATLLPLDDLKDVQGTLNNLRVDPDVKVRCRQVRGRLQAAADDRGVVLKLTR